MALKKFLSPCHGQNGSQMFCEIDKQNVITCYLKERINQAQVKHLLPGSCC